jgi:hypothetical protein
MGLVRRIGVGAVIVLLGLVAAFAWYLASHSMQPARAFEAGAPQAPTRVLIATQGSVFKDAVVASVVEYLKRRQTYVKVVDVSTLADVKAADWSAVLVIHTWQYGKPPTSVGEFAGREGAVRNVVVMTTSGSGKERLAGVDAVSAASVDQDAATRASELIRRLGTILGPAP